MWQEVNIYYIKVAKYYLLQYIKILEKNAKLLKNADVKKWVIVVKGFHSNVS